MCTPKEITVALLTLSTFFFVCPMVASADVVESAADGFQIKISIKTSVDKKKAYEFLTKGYAKWWDGNHSYSGKAENLSMNFDKGCIYEKLPAGGFVRHMEIVYSQPGTALRLTGGLGPLQEMGVNGALTFKLIASGDATEIQLAYNVAGFSKQGLDKIAPAVDQVLREQMARLKKLCDQNKVSK